MLAYNENAQAFEEYASQHSVGLSVCGPVLSVAPYGLYCELAQGVKGLLLVPDFIGDNPKTFPDDYPRAGEIIRATIKCILYDRLAVVLTQKPPA